MKICIYGAGAVGGHFAARLAQAGEDVSVIARGSNLDAIKQNGLKLLVGDETIHVRPKAAQDPVEIGTQDVVIVTVKGPALPGIVDGIKALIDEDTPIVFAMNGIPWWYFYGLDAPGKERRLDIIDPGNRWWNEIGPRHAVGGVVNSANVVIAPGVVRYNSVKSSVLRIGEPDGSISDRCRRINEALSRAGVAVPVADDIRREIWTKLLGNMAFAPVCSLTSSNILDVASDAALRKLCIAIITEAIVIADALGTKIDVDPEQRIGGPGKLSAHKPSMLQDLELERPMEIDSILSVPQAFGRMTGVPTPNLDLVLALLKQRARSAGLYEG